MKQYEKSGPPVQPKTETAGSDNSVELRRLLDQQDAKIKQLELDLRRVRNDLRTVINSLNARRG
jgi:hypothetical protein